MTEFIKIEQSAFRLIINEDKNASAVLNSVENGFELILKRGKKRFKLYTQRNKVRVFKTPNTAIKFLIDMEVKQATINLKNSKI